MSHDRVRELFHDRETAVSNASFGQVRKFKLAKQVERSFQVCVRFSPRSWSEVTVSQVRLLGHDGDLEWAQGSDLLLISRPESSGTKYAYVFEVTLE